MTPHHGAAFTAEWASRDAAARADAAWIASLLARADARVLPVWRGKPLITDAGALGWLAPDAQVLTHAVRPMLYLGTDDGPRFAADVSDWEPDALDRTALAMFLDTTEQPCPGAPGDHRFRDLRAMMTTLPASQAAQAATARALFNWHRTHGFCSACGARSDIDMAGWQRTCPTCGARHFPRTDPVVIMLVLRGNRTLLGRSPGWPEGMYSALAGFVEPGETIEAAVRREVAEETGIAVGRVRYALSQPWPFPSSLMFGCVAEALSDAIDVDDELDDAIWLSREDMLQVVCGEHPRVTAARPGSIARHMITEWLAGRLGADGLADGR